MLLHWDAVKTPAISKQGMLVLESEEQKLQVMSMMPLCTGRQLYCLERNKRACGEEQDSRSAQPGSGALTYGFVILFPYLQSEYHYYTQHSSKDWMVLINLKHLVSLLWLTDWAIIGCQQTLPLGISNLYFHLSDIITVYL